MVISPSDSKYGEIQLCIIISRHVLMWQLYYFYCQKWLIMNDQLTQHTCSTWPEPWALRWKWQHLKGRIWCQNDVVSTLIRRHHVASTLIRRHFTSCARWAADSRNISTPVISNCWCLKVNFLGPENLLWDIRNLTWTSTLRYRELSVPLILQNLLFCLLSAPF